MEKPNKLFTESDIINILRDQYKAYCDMLKFVKESFTLSDRIQHYDTMTYAFIRILSILLGCEFHTALYLLEKED